MLQPSRWSALGKRSAHIVLATSVFAWVALAPRRARAEACLVSTNGPLYDALQSGLPSAHPSNVDATWILPSDCANDVLVEVPVSIILTPPDPGDYVVTAYATDQPGVDCAVSTNNSGATGVCWRVALSPGALDAPAAPQSTYALSVRELLRGVGQAPGVGLPYVTATASACNLPPLPCPTLLIAQLIVADLGGNEICSLQIAFAIDAAGAPVSGGLCGVSTPAPADAATHLDAASSEDAGGRQDAEQAQGQGPSPGGALAGEAEAPNGRAGCDVGGGAWPDGTLGGALFALAGRRKPDHAGKR